MMNQIKKWIKSNFDIYNNLIQLLFQFLPSKYAIAMREIDISFDEVTCCDYHIYKHMDPLIIIPIKFIDFDWNDFFSRSIEINRCMGVDNIYAPYCEHLTIPPHITIKTEYYDCDNYTPCIVYDCIECDSHNQFVIEEIIQKEFTILQIHYIWETNNIPLTVL